MADVPTQYRLRDSGVAWRQTGDEMVVLDVARSEYFGLNASAAQLWLVLQDGATRAELVSRLMSEPTVTLGRAETDVDAFLHALTERHLIDLN